MEEYTQFINTIYRAKSEGKLIVHWKSGKKSEGKICAQNGHEFAILQEDGLTITGNVANVEFLVSGQGKPAALDKIDQETYAVQHNPNYPRPFLVRLVGRSAGFLDFKPQGETNDLLGYGQTLEEAAGEALHTKQGGG